MNLRTIFPIAAVASVPPRARPRTGVAHLTPATRPASRAANDTAPTDLSDESLIAAVARGESRALAILHKRHAAHLRVVAIAVLGREHRASVDDLVQDVFLALADGAARAHRPGSVTVKSWLSAIARRAARVYDGGPAFVSLEEEQLREGESDAKLEEELTGVAASNRRKPRTTL